MASLVSAVPQVVWISEHKIPLFIFAGLMLCLSGVATYLNRRMPCPSDAALAKSCLRVRRVSLGVFIISLTIYAIGFYFAFLASRQE